MRLPFSRAVLFALFSISQSSGAPITALAYAPDGSRLVSSGYQRVELRTPDGSKTKNSIAVDIPRIASLAFTREGLLVVGGGSPGATGAVAMIDWKARRRFADFAGFTDLVTSVAISGDGKWLGLASADHSARIQPLAPKRGDGISLTGHSEPVLAIAFAPASEFVITASGDRSIKTWSLKGEVVRSFNHHTEAVHALAIRPRGEGEPIECASGSDDHTVRIWQPAIGRMVRIIRGHQGSVFALAYTPDGKALFSAGKEGIIRRLDVTSDEILAQKAAHADAIYSLAISADGRRLASGDWRGEVKVWNLSESGEFLNEPVE